MYRFKVPRADTFVSAAKWLAMKNNAFCLFHGRARRHLDLVQHADVEEYRKMISAPGYPANQRVLLITNAPENTTLKHIHDHFKGI